MGQRLCLAVTAIICGIALASSAAQAQSGAPPTATQPEGQSQLPTERIRIGGNVMAAQLLHMVPPVYPAIARTARIQGTVVLHAVIAKDGTIKDLQYVSGPPLLMHSAMDAVKQWTYKPYLLNGQPVEVDTTIEVVFAIAGSPQSPVTSGEEAPRVSVVIPKLTGPATGEAGTFRPEEILLKDGSKIVGRVVEVNGDIFEVEMSHSRIEVNRSDIVSITFPANQSGDASALTAGSSPVPAPARKIEQSLKGTTYTNSQGHFTLTVPDGWRTNDELALKTPNTIGVLSSTDNASNIMMQWIKESNDPVQLAQLIDSMFKASFEGYQKLDQYPVTIDGRAGQVLMFRAVISIGKVSEQAGTDSAADTTLKIPAKYMLTLIKADDGIEDIMCVAPETAFDKMLPAFTAITYSFRSLPSAATPPVPHSP